MGREIHHSCKPRIGAPLMTFGRFDNIRPELSAVAPTFDGTSGLAPLDSRVEHL